MPTVEFGGKTFTVDEDGFIDDYTNWAPEWVQYVKSTEGIDELNDRHWQVIEFCRQDFEEKGEAPSLRRITKAGGVPTKELYKLFPKGQDKKVARIYGLGKPTGCI